MSRFRLDPTPEQRELLLGLCGQARFVWNLGLEQRSMWRPGRGPSPGYNAQSAQLTEARADCDWLRAGSQTVQQQALRDLERAYQRFFDGTSGYPTWRRAGQHEGFRIVGPAALRIEQINRKWSRVLVPKVGWVRFRRSRPLAEFKSYRVTLDRRGRWHIAFASVPVPIPAPGTGEIVGVDRGVAVSAALSTGEKLHAPGLTPKEAERLVRLQRRLARAKKGSNRRKFLVGKIARLKAREADRRKDWVEQVSTDLARRFDLIGLEDLKTRQMTKSAKGTVAQPGKNVKAKTSLNRAILRHGWGLLETRLEHKAPGRVMKVNPAWTSQTCSACGTRDGRNRESQAVFCCVSCGFAENADVNAAAVIRDLAVQQHALVPEQRKSTTSKTAAGRAVAGRRDTAALGRSVKRQPPARRAATAA